jgi:hypothetical protein
MEAFPQELICFTRFLECVCPQVIQELEHPLAVSGEDLRPIID